MSTTTVLPVSVGALCRVTNPNSDKVGMSGRIIRITGGFALVILDAWGSAHVIALSDLTVVRQPQRAPAERGAGEL